MYVWVWICDITQAPQTLQLKLGTQVMLLCNRNVSKGFGNGARGVVVGFADSKNWVPEHHGHHSKGRINQRE